MEALIRKAGLVDLARGIISCRLSIGTMLMKIVKMIVLSLFH